MEQLKIGEYKLTWLDGGVTHMDGGAMFGVVPKPLWSKKYPVNDKNQIELRTDPILIEGHGKRALIEAGIGNGKLNEKERRNYGVTHESNIEKSLSTLGLSASDIDFVLMTHMHFDHVTGLSKWQGDRLVPTFENATVVTSKTEWEEMKSPNIRSKNTYWKRNWEPVTSQVEVFEGEMEVLPGVTLHHTGGHSDGHSVITLESNGEFAIHMADIMPTHAHDNVLWVLAYDDYPMTSIEQKQKWIPAARERQGWFIFYHDAEYRAIKFDGDGKIMDKIERKKAE